MGAMSDDLPTGISQFAPFLPCPVTTKKSTNLCFGPRSVGHRGRHRTGNICSVGIIAPFDVPMRHDDLDPSYRPTAIVLKNGNLLQGTPPRL